MKVGVAIVGYSGHSFVASEILMSVGFNINGYFEEEEKENNPLNFKYLGSEDKMIADKVINNEDYFVAVGDNLLRKKITLKMELHTKRKAINAIDVSAAISHSATIGKGVMIGPRAIINASCIIGDGVICNSGCIVEHECVISNFVHIAPGAILCGNIEIGENSFIGAGSIIKQGVTVGANCIIGAGTVVIKNISDNSKVVGNPARMIK